MTKRDVLELDLAASIALREELDKHVESLKAQAAADLRSHIEAQATLLGLSISQIVNGTGGRRRRKQPVTSDNGGEAS